MVATHGVFPKLVVESAVTDRFYDCHGLGCRFQRYAGFVHATQRAEHPFEDRRRVLLRIGNNLLGNRFAGSVPSWGGKHQPDLVAWTAAGRLGGLAQFGHWRQEDGSGFPSPAWLSAENLAGLISDFAEPHRARC